ncbi:hypothetical protein QAD02_022157 [Eretmocerus hayati]|uniref:Uncharacterized protein n=1 Tax=Eretmocerus hayati TaxID=131215 RepID=A0ACC2PS96_9HYME|nr:hypothetical protein QAD02_022157 [Eretmocerus hayati]
MSNRTVGVAEQSNNALADIAAVLRAILNQMQENAANAALQEKVSNTLCEKVTSAVLDLRTAINSILIMSSHVKKAQIDFLMAYMLKHPRFEQGRNNEPDGKTQRKDQWALLCRKYNKIGGTYRTPKSLQKKWKRMKSAAKKEWAENKKKPTGNVTGEEIKMMSKDTLKMMCIVGTSHGNGLPLVPEIGLGYRPEFDEIE